MKPAMTHGQVILWQGQFKNGEQDMKNVAILLTSVPQAGESISI